MIIMLLAKEMSLFMLDPKAAAHTKSIHLHARARAAACMHRMLSMHHMTPNKSHEEALKQPRNLRYAWRIFNTPRDSKSVGGEAETML